MKRDFFAELVSEERSSIEGRITSFGGRSSQRLEWMRSNLRPLLTKDSSRLAFFQQFDRLSLFYRLFEAEGKKSGRDEWKDDIRTVYTDLLYPAFSVPQEVMTTLQTLGLHTDAACSVDSLPAYSFAIKCQFRLRKPYLSKDEQDFYIIDNSVRKDKVFKLPYVAPSSWKGSLRAAIRLIKQSENPNWCENDDCQVHRLFGPVKGEEREDHFRQGRLHFFPTFFTQLSLEVINPHDRRTGAGTKPIYIESVPIKTQGAFTLLYVPFDRIGEDEAETRKQVAEDLTLVTKGIKAMLTTYGFGAKTSSGFGAADILADTVKIEIRAEERENLQEAVNRAEQTLKAAEGKAL